MVHVVHVVNGVPSRGHGVSSTGACACVDAGVVYSMHCELKMARKMRRRRKMRWRMWWRRRCMGSKYWVGSRQRNGTPGLTIECCVCVYDCCESPQPP